ncbi:regulatory protein RecX [Aerosakkonemataceae cyanobacterium BLCC-F154]|uniref:Regulatory protein RecX n=1 Tax=Floridaenema fluviatile BLCC-F154 TaxID=3153640 RepID=A0ABV4YIB1_9CYAN
MTCLNYFYQLLARREYSVRELEKKGQEKGFEASEITDAINHLQNLGYQSDTRLVESLIASSQGKYGKSMVKRKCFEKGISSDVFEEVWLAQEEHEETDDLADLKAKVMRKYHLTDFGNIDPKTKSKLVNYLQYRGFNAWQILAQWQKEEDE